MHAHISFVLILYTMIFYTYKTNDELYICYIMVYKFIDDTDHGLLPKLGDAPSRLNLENDDDIIMGLNAVLYFRHRILNGFTAWKRCLLAVLSSESFGRKLETGNIFSF